MPAQYRVPERGDLARAGEDRSSASSASARPQPRVRGRAVRALAGPDLPRLDLRALFLDGGGDRELGRLIGDELTWDQPGLSDLGGLLFQAGVWIAIAFFGVFRFLSYIDRRIRLEGWELELRLKAVGRAARGESRIDRLSSSIAAGAAWHRDVASADVRPMPLPPARPVRTPAAATGVNPAGRAEPGRRMPSGQGSYPWYDSEPTASGRSGRPGCRGSRAGSIDVERAFDAIGRFLNRLNFGRPQVTRESSGNWIGTILLLGRARRRFSRVLAVLWVRAGVGRPWRSRSQAARLGTAARLGRASGGHPAGRRRSLGRSAAAAAAGDLAGAMVCLFAHQLLSLDQLGLIRLAPGRTGRQYVHGAADRELVDSLGATLALFEEVYYGRRRPTAQAFESVWSRALAFQERRGLRWGRRDEASLGHAGSLRRAGDDVQSWSSRAVRAGLETDVRHEPGDELERDFGLRRDAARPRARGANRRSGSTTSWRNGPTGSSGSPPTPARPRGRGGVVSRWLAEDPDRWLIYVVRDFDTRRRILEETCATASPSPREPDRRAEAEDNARRGRRLGRAGCRRRPRTAADPRHGSRSRPPGIRPESCTKLSGPWAEGIDAAAAALDRARATQGERRARPAGGRRQAAGPGKDVDRRAADAGDRQRIVPLERGAGQRRHAGRWPSACSTGPESELRRIAMVEGSFVLGGRRGHAVALGSAAADAVLRWVAIQVGLAGLLAALARAPRLGRPRPDPPRAPIGPRSMPWPSGALLAQAGAADRGARAARALPALALPARAAGQNLGVAALRLVTGEPSPQRLSSQRADRPSARPEPRSTDLDHCSTTESDSANG